MIYFSIDKLQTCQKQALFSIWRKKSPCKPIFPIAGSGDGWALAAFLPCLVVFLFAVQLWDSSRQMPGFGEFIFMAIVMVPLTWSGLWLCRAFRRRSSPRVPLGVYALPRYLVRVRSLYVEVWFYQELEKIVRECVRVNGVPRDGLVLLWKGYSTGYQWSPFNIRNSREAAIVTIQQCSQTVAEGWSWMEPEFDPLGLRDAGYLEKWTHSADGGETKKQQRKRTRTHLLNGAAIGLVLATVTWLATGVINDARLFDEARKDERLSREEYLKSGWFRKAELLRIIESEKRR